MGLIARKGFEMYDLELLLWSIVPIVNTSVFVGVLVSLLFNWRMFRRWKMVLAFTGFSFFASFARLIVEWWDIAYSEPGYIMLDPIGPFATYTVVTAWVAGISLLALGLWKAYELLRSPKTEEKKK